MTSIHQMTRPLVYLPEKKSNANAEHPDLSFFYNFGTILPNNPGSKRRRTVCADTPATTAAPNISFLFKRESLKGSIYNNILYP